MPFADAINNCCVTHDNCYTRQEGQSKCDATFCDCLDGASRGSDICYKDDAPYFCSLVKDLGATFYAAANK